MRARCWRALGLRARLALALAGTAIAAVALATILANSGLEPQLDRIARERLHRSAEHVADVAAELYARDGRWTPSGRRQLRHAALIVDMKVVIDGSVDTLPSARAPVVVEGRRVATLAVAPADPDAFEAEDRDLHRRLNRLHLAAAALAALLAVLAAVLFAVPLARPLRTMTAGARRMEEGHLDVRVEPAGGRELEQLAHALNRLAGTLAHAERLRREAVADIAHELRSPLTGIVSRIEAAQDGVLTDDAANLAAIHGEAMRLTRLADDLAQLGDAQRPGLLLDTAEIDLADLAARRAKALAERFLERDIALRTELAPARVRGDRGRLEQVFDNLLSNAQRYTEAGGTVTVRTRVDGPDAVIEVSDTGVGIAAEDLPYVFERFWRSDKSRAQHTGGTGIGLAIVRELVRAHDGHVDVTSRPGHGTTMTVRLPRP